jgi:hypothetical protein
MQRSFYIILPIKDIIHMKRREGKTGTSAERRKRKRNSAERGRKREATPLCLPLFFSGLFFQRL